MDRSHCTERGRGLSNEHEGPASCPLPFAPDPSRLTVVALEPEERVPDYRAAMRIANAGAEKRIGGHVLLSGYDRDRAFESPQHTSECHQDSAVPGYVDYAISHGASLGVDIEGGRFVFFCLPVDFD